MDSKNNSLVFYHPNAIRQHLRRIAVPSDALLCKEFPLEQPAVCAMPAGTWVGPFR